MHASGTFLVVLADYVAFFSSASNYEIEDWTLYKWAYNVHVNEAHCEKIKHL